MLRSFFKTKPEILNKKLTIKGNVFSVSDGRRGFISYFKNDDTIGRSIFKYGEWAENEISFLKNLIPQSGTVVDIGSNIGTHAIAFSELVGDRGIVLAFEPQRLAHQILCANIVLSGFTNIYTHWCALSDHSGYLEESKIDYREPGQNFGAVFFRENKESDFNYRSISVRKLDDFSLEKCDLIKIDAEGMEEKVLSGSIQTIKNKRPIIYFEAAGWEWIQGVEKFFSDKDYSLYLHFVNAYNPNNFQNNKENIFGEAKERNIIAIPKEKHNLLSSQMSDLVLFSKENFK